MVKRTPKCRKVNGSTVLVIILGLYLWMASRSADPVTTVKQTPKMLKDNIGNLLETATNSTLDMAQPIIGKEGVTSVISVLHSMQQLGNQSFHSVVHALSDVIGQDGVDTLTSALMNITNAGGDILGDLSLELKSFNYSEFGQGGVDTLRNALGPEVADAFTSVVSNATNTVIGNNITDKFSTVLQKFDAQQLGKDGVDKLLQGLRGVTGESGLETITNAFKIAGNATARLGAAIRTLDVSKIPEASAHLLSDVWQTALGNTNSESFKGTVQKMDGIGTTGKQALSTLHNLGKEKAQSSPKSRKSSPEKPTSNNQQNSPRDTAELFDLNDPQQRQQALARVQDNWGKISGSCSSGPSNPVSGKEVIPLEYPTDVPVDGCAHGKLTKLKTIPPFPICVHDPREDTIISQRILNGGVWDDDIVMTPARHALKGKPQGIVIDAGSNLGQLSVYAAGVGHIVYSIEPLPYNNELLTRSIRHNGWKNVHIFQNGLSDNRHSMTLQVTKGNIGGSHLQEYSTGRKLSSVLSKTAEVHTMLLDDLVLHIRKHHPGKQILFLKLDVEGYEPRALRGGVRLLTIFRIPTIALEIQPAKWASNKCDIKRTLSGLMLLGYEMNHGQTVIHQRNLDQWINRVKRLNTIDVLLQKR